MKVWIKALQALLPWLLCWYQKFLCVPLCLCKASGSSVQQEQSEQAGKCSCCVTITLPEFLDYSNLFMIMTSNQTVLFGKPSGCFLYLNLYIFGIQFFPVVVGFSLRKVKCSWIEEVPHFVHTEIKQSNVCRLQGALHYFEILKYINVVWRVLSS